MNEASILLVDDEVAIVKMMETVLRKEGFQHIYTAHTAKEALDLLQKHLIDIILLDVMLPDKSGFDICPKIRELSNAYILFVTAKVSDLDVLTGFAIGGDDYVTKPFNPLEIAARIKARLRRKEALLEQPNHGQSVSMVKRYTFDHFIVDETAGELIVNGKVVACPAQVFLLLLHFCKNVNIVLSKSQLLEAVWGYNQFVDENTVTVHIRRIRERIEENPGNPKHLLTVRGLGYKLVRGKTS
ncbi:DNA-binding response regulator [Priestia aryabhattai]|uniref:response regulator transcription factor n=1 Tax=Bacillaceae TaxID=186817 RepID=UPI000BA12B2C|nr:response regulator transcription factor [Bacillus sp. CBEL-1]MBY6023437.1 response regulator transcription factor [Nitratireductor sp. DP7N14-4]OZT12663.1 DNA-binding response regulator [Priestia aryabhattai]TDB53878.1 response regulator transcription factor [Bacillus sp. CBEL-1]